MRGPIRLTLDHMRIAAKKPRRGTPACHDETMKVLNALEASKFESCGPIHKYVKEAEECLEKARADARRGQTSSLYHLNKYLDRK